MAWTEISFESDVRDIQVVRDILHVRTIDRYHIIDFKQFSPIEEGANLSLTACSPMTYYIRHDTQAGIPHNIDDYNYGRGHLLGKFTGKVFTGSQESDPQEASVNRNAVPFGALNLRRYDDAAKFIFRGRQVTLDSLLMEVST